MRNHLRGRRQEMASWCASLKRRDWPESLLTSSACGHTRILRGTGFWKKKTNPPHPSGAAGRGHSLAGREKAAWGESSLMLSFVSFMGHGALSQPQESNLPSLSSQFVSRDILPQQDRLASQTGSNQGSSIQIARGGHSHTKYHSSANRANTTS